MSFRRAGFIKAAVIAAALIAAPQAIAETVSVNLDQAKVLRLPERVATIVIGNPLIADASLQSGGILVLTGKGYGSTNMLALDRQGRVIMDRNIQVAGPGQSDVVIVYKGVDRESYSCSPECSPRITLGDTANYFNAVSAQIGARNGMASPPTK
jgi:hypothetical protein